MQNRANTKVYAVTTDRKPPTFRIGINLAGSDDFVEGDDGMEFSADVKETFSLNQARVTGIYNHNDRTFAITGVVTSSTGQLTIPEWTSGILTIQVRTFLQDNPLQEAYNNTNLNIVEGHFVVDATLGNDFTLNLNDDATLDFPTGLRDKQVLTFQINQYGGNILTLDEKFAFGSTITSYTVSSGGGISDYLICKYDASMDQLKVIDIKQGFYWPD